MRTSTKLKAAYVALAVTDTWLSGAAPRLRRARVLTKPLLIPVLAAGLATDPAAKNSPLRTSTLTALAFGWGGDVALLGSGTKSFLAGTTSFGMGHVAYAAGFRSQRSSRSLPEAPGARVALALWALSAPALAVAAGRKEAALGPAVLGYSALLASMFATATNLEQSASAGRLSAVGAALFMASDTALGVRKFMLTEPPPSLERGVMATYTSAQFLLAQGAARSR